jgi:flagellar hook-associated protein 1 FlgK
MGSNLLNLGARAMLANQAALAVAGHNIANVNTPGYSRQTAAFETATPQFTGAGFVGKGVDVANISRSYNRFLSVEAYGARAEAARDQTLRTNLERLEQLFPPGEQGLGNAANQFLNAMIDLTSRPADPSSRQVVLGRAQELASRFASAGTQLADLQAGVNTELRIQVGKVNDLARQLAQVNNAIAQLAGSGKDPNDLLDQRDQLVYDISQYVAISTVEPGDGTITVFVGGGQKLVLGAQAEQLAVEGDAFDPLRSRVSLVQPGGLLPLDDSLLAAGSIAGLLKFQNDDLQAARNGLGQLATALALRVNERQALGLDLSNPPGAGAPLFDVGTPQALPASTNAKDAFGNYLAGVAVTWVEPNQLQASSYLLKADPAVPGSYLLTRESDGLVRSVADGDIVDGFQISFNPAAPGAFDQFRIEPVATAALNMRRILDAPQGLAAASPITAVTNVANTGTATVDTLYVVDPAGVNVGAQLPEFIFGTANADGSVNYQVVGLFGTLNGVWRAGQPIGNEAGIALGFELRLNGVPRNGDRITIDATLYPDQNNGNAKAFLDLQTEAFVGQRPLAGGGLGSGFTFSDAYAGLVGDIGTRTQSARFLSEVSTNVASEALTARESEAGVNLDEEAARLLQFQQAYQASARLLQVAQATFDELLNAVR